MMLRAVLPSEVVVQQDKYVCGCISAYLIIIRSDSHSTVTALTEEREHDRIVALAPCCSALL
jgi:hypothetical protein